MIKRRTRFLLLVVIAAVALATSLVAGPADARTHKTREGRSRSPLRTYSARRLGASILGASCVIALVACGDRDSNGVDRPTTTLGPSSTAELSDLPARELIGMSGNEMLDRIFIDKYRSSTRVGDGWVRDFGSVRFSTERLNLVKSLVPDKAAQYEMYTGVYRIVAACVTQDKADNSFSLHLGTLPQEFVSDLLITAGRKGEYLDILERNTPCHSWGPMLPLSQMH